MESERRTNELDPADRIALERLRQIDEFTAQGVIRKVFPDLAATMQEHWNASQESASEDAFFKSRKEWAVTPTIDEIESRGLALGRGPEISSVIDEMLAEKR